MVKELQTWLQRAGAGTIVSAASKINELAGLSGDAKHEDAKLATAHAQVPVKLAEQISREILDVLASLTPQAAAGGATG